MVRKNIKRKKWVKEKKGLKSQIKNEQKKIVKEKADININININNITYKKELNSFLYILL